MNESDPLSNLLSRWQPAPEADPTFAETVRSRINDTGVPASSGIVGQILRFPATLPLAAGFAVVIGVSAAVSLDQRRNTAEMAEAYARSIDPIWMTAEPEHQHH